MSPGNEPLKSRRAAVDVPYFLSKYDPDPLRYCRRSVVPETPDKESRAGRSPMQHSLDHEQNQSHCERQAG